MFGHLLDLLLHQKQDGNMAKMSIQNLLKLQAALDSMLSCGAIDLYTYNCELDDILLVAGWTVEEYLAEIDRRWDYVCIEQQENYFKPS